MTDSSEEVGSALGYFFRLFTTGQISNEFLFFEIPEENTIVSSGGDDEIDVISVPV